MRKIFIIFIFAVFAVPLWAKGEEILILGRSSSTTETVPIYDSATARIFGRSFVLIGKSSAVRKNQFLTKSSTYVMQMFVQNIAAYDAIRVCTDSTPNADNALNAFDSQNVVAIRLDFVSYLNEGPQREFSDAFRANGIDTKDPAIAQFLSLVGENSVVPGDSLTIVIERNVGGNDVLLLENTKGMVGKIVGSLLARLITSLWIGRPSIDRQPDFARKLLCGM
ncbi:hypothetical protein [Bradyrhizobium sp. SZCCHNR1051]|uniref:hypothetical protein n=1 Tax=Bradyrhizobium sp. SZCCHNR1051 TaxID=3057355 RepID=UPI002915CC82|nr:hypothetical protein [Bradyrhizobium sp. SZCCHNR1051]